jgi:tetratricopeptide (TPR) repeat protein
VRVTAELLDATANLQLWGETYDRALTATNLFEIQDRLSERIVATIADAYGVLARSALDEGRRSAPGRLDAYECVLRAHAYNAIHTEASHLAARNCLERTVEADPGYADAWAQLAYLHRESHHHGFNPRPDSIDAALGAARRAVELDPTNQLGQLALALAYFNRGDLDGFFAAAERALALNPNETRVLASVALNMTYVDDSERGVALMRKAMALSPLHPGWFHLAPFHHHYRRGEYAEALAAAQRIGAPELWDGYAALAQAYGQLGRAEEAESALAGLLRVYPDFAEHAYDEFARRQIPEPEIEHLIEGLRKAGLAVPEPAG